MECRSQREGALRLSEVGGLHGRVTESADGVGHSGWHWSQRMASATVDGIGVHGNVVEVVADATHRLLGERSLLGGPLEGRDNVVLDLVEVLDTDSVVDEDVGASGVRPEAPDLAGEVDVPGVVVGEGCRLEGSTILEGTEVKGHSVIKDSLIGLAETESSASLSRILFDLVFFIWCTVLLFNIIAGLSKTALKGARKSAEYT